MMNKIDVVCLSDSVQAPEWRNGRLFCCDPTPSKLNPIIEANLETSTAEAWLFWDACLPLPPADLLSSLLSGPDDVWHAGLLLGTAGQPNFIDFVNPTWMHNCDPPANIEATSWRLSLRACLVRTEVLRQLGGPNSAFDSLDAAALELGHRYLRRGAFVRHTPALLPHPVKEPSLDLPLTDQLRFLKLCYGERWLRWACLRAVISRTASLPGILQAYRRAAKIFPDKQPVHLPPGRPDRFSASQWQGICHRSHCWTLSLPAHAARPASQPNPPSSRDPGHRPDSPAREGYWHGGGFQRSAAALVYP